MFICGWVRVAELRAPLNFVICTRAPAPVATPTYALRRCASGDAHLRLTLLRQW